MLRKSVETRDCLSAIEPRTVRAVMKRVVEDVAAMDVVIGQLYEEGIRTERTSDSTRRSYTYAAIGRQNTVTGPARSTWSITPRYMQTNKHRHQYRYIQTGGTTAAGLFRVT